MSKFSWSEPSALLSVGELARRSGLATATIRSWEARHGFPRPERLPGGHRRYREEDVSLVVEVARLRRTGLSLEAAIAAARRGAVVPANDSLFAHLRAGSPELRTQVLSKAVLRSLCSAMEDEYCARAERALLLATFQREAFYRQAERRWVELARTAVCAVVFADFTRFRREPQVPVEVPIAADAPLGREWNLVCDAPGYAVCLAAWELPEASPVADDDRLFETVWSIDARIVRQASRVGVGLLADADPELAATLGGHLSDEPAGASKDLQQATSLFARFLSYTQEARGATP